MSLKTYKELVVALVRTGGGRYGGGPSIIPLIRHEAVTWYAWVNDEEFGEILALANTLPGPIATKMAAYLGYRTARTPGAVVAVISHILPSVLAMVFLLGALTAFRKSPIVLSHCGLLRCETFILHLSLLRPLSMGALSSHYYKWEFIAINYPQPVRVRHKQKSTGLCTENCG